MKQRLAWFFLIFTMSNGLNCSANSSPRDSGQNTLDRSFENVTGTSECDEWQRTFERLSDAGKETLRVHNIAINGDDPSSSSGYFVISPSLVGDCKSRVQIGHFLYAVMEGTDNESDRKIALGHSQELVEVLRNVWDTGELSHEKDSLLVNSGIRDEDIAPLIDDLLQRRGFDSGIVYTLATRPSASPERSLIRILNRAELERDLPNQIYSLIALEQTMPKRIYLSKLKLVTRNKNLTFKTKKALTMIIQKFEAGKNVSFKEVEDLELPLPD